MFKANIEITSIEEFKKLNEVKVIKEPKIVYKDKIVKVPVEKIVDRIVEVKDDSCPICGSNNYDIETEKNIWDFAGINSSIYKVKSKYCLVCGNGYTVKAD